jgi:hypothetical protein
MNRLLLPKARAWQRGEASWILCLLEVIRDFRPGLKVVLDNSIFARSRAPKARGWAIFPSKPRGGVRFLVGPFPNPAGAAHWVAAKDCSCRLSRQAPANQVIHFGAAAGTSCAAVFLINASGSLSDVAMFSCHPGGTALEAEAGGSCAAWVAGTAAPDCLASQGVRQKTRPSLSNNVSEEGVVFSATPVVIFSRSADPSVARRSPLAS